MNRVTGIQMKKNGRRGFTLIELLVVIMILSILFSIVVISMGGVFTTARETAYTSIKGQLVNAIVAYQVHSLGNYPVTGEAVIIDGNVHAIIDICSLLTSADPPGMLRAVPDGFAAIDGPDNCNGGCSCDPQAHYIWAVDLNGVIRTLCVDTAENGGGCANTSSDGFQGVWP